MALYRKRLIISELEEGELSKIIISIVIALFVLIILGSFLIASLQNIDSNSKNATVTSLDDGEYTVESVIDGDTIRVNYDGKVESVRLIGVDAPEVSHSSDEKSDCYGDESTEFLRKLIDDNNNQVKLKKDSKTDDRDKYGRLLRYAYAGEDDIQYELINNGYAHEYTYDVIYDHQAEYLEAQTNASRGPRGLWKACKSSGDSNIEDNDLNTKNEPNNPSIPTPPKEEPKTNCDIKGNISYNTGEKIYHVPGQKYYNSTTINEAYGERWFCSEAEAQAAGWRKSRE